MENKAMLLFLVLNYLILFCFTEAQTPIPAKYDGFVYQSTKRTTCKDTIVVEAFFDPMCPDSRDSWAPLKQALQYYSDHVSLIVHPFPLPYHSNAFLACRALHIANKLNESSTYPLLELFFKYQEKYYNFPTYNMSKAKIVNKFSKLAVAAVGQNSFAAFKSGFNDSTTDTAARISFKYGCTRGVYGTPFFFVNGFALPDGGSALDYKTWRTLIDPLVAKQRI